RIALAQPERTIIDHRHHAHGVDLAEDWVIGRAIPPSPVLALIFLAHLLEHPKYLAHVDGVGAPINLEHETSPRRFTAHPINKRPNVLDGKHDAVAVRSGRVCWPWPRDRSDGRPRCIALPLAFHSSKSAACC